jgi:hypothetical protein
LKTEEAEPAGFGLLLLASIMLDGSSAAYEVHNDRDQSEDQQQVNEKAADV